MKNPISKASDTGVDPEKATLGAPFPPTDNPNLHPTACLFVPNNQRTAAVTRARINAAIRVAGAKGVGGNGKP